MSPVASKPRTDLQAVDAALRGGLVVSCQPVDGGPMDEDGVVVRMARAAVAAGAVAVRIEGARRLALVRQEVNLPIIGIVKRDLKDVPVRITPFVADVQALAAAGADIVAVDVTRRPRPVPVQVLHQAILDCGALAMADASDADDALAAWRQGFSIVGTTLSGYTGGPVPDAPDLSLVARLADAGCRVMAEGRYDTPQLAAQALGHGAWAVTVGSALTRLEVAAGRFVQALGRRVYG